MTYDVVIPCYNAARFVAETIASIRAQSVAPHRIIAVDDGSTDDTLTVLRALLPASDVVTQPNRGPGAATMAGIALSSADTIAFVDADDLWLPRKLARQLHTLSASPAPVAVFCRMEPFTDGDEGLAADQALSGWSRSTLVMRRGDFDLVGPISDMPNRIGEMVDWFSRAREKGVDLLMLEEVLARRRLHAASLTRRSANTSEGYLAAARSAILRRRQRNE